MRGLRRCHPHTNSAKPFSHVIAAHLLLVSRTKGPKDKQCKTSRETRSLYSLYSPHQARSLFEPCETNASCTKTLANPHNPRRKPYELAFSMLPKSRDAIRGGGAPLCGGRWRHAAPGGHPGSGPFFSLGEGFVGFVTLNPNLNPELPCKASSLLSRWEKTLV